MPSVRDWDRGSWKNTNGGQPAPACVFMAIVAFRRTACARDTVDLTQLAIWFVDETYLALACTCQVGPRGHSYDSHLCGVTTQARIPMCKQSTRIKRTKSKYDA
jgi:hypothetical protein